MKVSCVIHVREGIVQNPAAMYKAYASLKGGTYEVEFSKLNKRSLQQNKYLHKILIPEFKNALNGVGYDEVKTDAQAKLIMKKMFLTRTIPNKDTGEYLEYVQDTSDLSKEQMSVLFDEVIKFCAENMNYIIAYPNEQLEAFKNVD